jgi:hypothetical protein
MDRKKLAIKQGLRVWMVLTFILFYFFMVAALWILFHPVIAVIVLFLTFGVVYLFTMRFYDLLAEKT